MKPLRWLILGSRFWSEGHRPNEGGIDPERRLLKRWTPLRLRRRPKEEGIEPPISLSWRLSFLSARNWLLFAVILPSKPFQGSWIVITCPFARLIPIQPPEQAPIPLSFQLLKYPFGSISSFLNACSPWKSASVMTTPSHPGAKATWGQWGHPTSHSQKKRYE